MKTIIDLPLWNRWKREWRVAKAELVNVAPHLPSGTFAVHRCPWDNYVWKVSNIETGTYCNDPFDGDTREMAIRSASERLAEKDDAWLRKAMRKAIRRQDGR